jgi:hypothetical protein
MIVPLQAQAREGWDRSTLRIGLIVGLASAVVASVLGYLCAPALTTAHPSTIQARELAGALFGGVMFVIMVIVSVQSVQSVRAIRTASRPGYASAAEKHAEDDADEEEPEDSVRLRSRSSGTAPDADLAGSHHAGVRLGRLCPHQAQLSRHR